VNDPTANRTVFGIDHVLPLETVVASHASVTARSANEPAHDMVTASDRLPLQLAVDHVAALVGPDAAALHARAAIGEPVCVPKEPDRWALWAGEQHCPCRVEDCRSVVRT